MKTTDRRWLEFKESSLGCEFKEIQIKKRIDDAVYEAEYKRLNDLLDHIHKQLESTEPEDPNDFVETDEYRMKISTGYVIEPYK